MNIKQLIIEKSLTFIYKADKYHIRIPADNK